MLIDYQVALRPYHTMALDVVAEVMLTLQHEVELPALWQQAQHYGEPLILGGGSNTVFLNDFKAAIVHIATRGQRVIAEDDERFIVRVAAGESWDHWVESSLKLGGYGLENLSLIPGTVGAAPVQNIGAYGVEVQDFIEGVHYWDSQTQKSQYLTVDECAFDYRDSIFKRQPHWVITAVDFRLPKKFKPLISYGNLAELLHCEQQNGTLSAHAVRRAVIALRQEKLPDPCQLPNSGSFFKNPILNVEQAEALQKYYPELPLYPHHVGFYKTSAAWLIEHCGLKGIREGGMGIFERHALIMVNYGHATPSDLASLCQQVTTAVAQRFGLVLQPEPRWVAESIHFAV